MKVVKAMIVLEQSKRYFVDMMFHIALDGIYGLRDEKIAFLMKFEKKKKFPLGVKRMWKIFSFIILI